MDSLQSIGNYKEVLQVWKLQGRTQDPGAICNRRESCHTSKPKDMWHERKGYQNLKDKSLEERAHWKAMNFLPYL